LRSFSNLYERWASCRAFHHCSKLLTEQIMEALMFNRYIEVHQSGLLQDLKEFIRIPSISTTGEGIADAVSFVVEQLSGAGFSTHVYQTAGHPIILGTSGPEDEGCKLLMYGHYDVFHDDDQQHWRTP